MKSVPMEGALISPRISARLLVQEVALITPIGTELFKLVLVTAPLTRSTAPLGPPLLIVRLVLAIDLKTIARTPNSETTLGTVLEPLSAEVVAEITPIGLESLIPPKCRGPLRTLEIKSALATVVLLMAMLAICTPPVLFTVILPPTGAPALPLPVKKTLAVPLVRR